MLASSLRACFHFHFNHYLVLVVLLVYSNDDDGDQRPATRQSRAESRQREWLDKWTTQSTVNQQRTKVNNDVDKANNKHKHKKNAKSRQRQRQRRRSKDLLHLHGSIAEFSRYRPITALWLRIQGHHSHNSRKRKQTHQEFMIHVEWLALEKRKKV